MYQKDFILRVIEACSDALARIIGLKKEGKNNLALDEIKRTYVEVLKININDILSTPTEEIKNIEIEKLEMISDLLKVEGEIEFTDRNNQRSTQLINKALELLELADQENTTFSFERKNKITDLKNLLNEI